MPKVSLVIPMYNVEKYLPECIESAQNQTLKDIEIILVDDGSPDNSGKIADEYAKKDERITVIHQQNKWLGAARNAGLKIAKGEYISCIDADDYLSLDFCEKLYDFSVKHLLDILIYPTYLTDDAGTIKSVTKKAAAFTTSNFVMAKILRKSFSLCLSALIM